MTKVLFTLSNNMFLGLYLDRLEADKVRKIVAKKMCKDITLSNGVTLSFEYGCRIKVTDNKSRVAVDSTYTDFSCEDK